MHQWLRRIGLVALAVLSCGAAPRVCSDYRAEQQAVFPRQELPEISGLVRGSGRFWWTHNDSGNAAKLFAIDERGRLLAEVTLRGARNIDWEELAVGPCPDQRGRCLYVGDIGNNGRRRKDLKIYVVREPQPRSGTVPVLQVLPIRFPDRSANSEAMVFDPDLRRLVIITKEPSGQSRIYARSLDPARALLEPLATLDLGSQDIGAAQVTGAALSADRSVFMLRTYLTALRWQRQPGEGWKKLFSRPPELIPLAIERQGEAIAFGEGNEFFYTISEEEPVLLRYRCAAPADSR